LNLNKKYKLITILGPTACGKTVLAANLANLLNGEIISADSRQVYKKMNIGTGKDYQDYFVNDISVPYHLIDIVDPGYKYNVYEYQEDFLNALDDIRSRDKFPILCGGTGLYIEAVVSGYKLIKVPVNLKLRQSLELFSMDKLTKILSSMVGLHNVSDTSSRKRLIRAIEIQNYYKNNPGISFDYPEIFNLFFGVNFDRDTVRKKITERLKIRLENGMIEEVQSLLDNGILAEQLIYYGLEYKFITWFIQNKLTYEEMFIKLNTAIHQFAKRQMTWFRKMERSGKKIYWIDGDLSMEDKIQNIVDIIKSAK